MARAATATARAAAPAKAPAKRPAPARRRPPERRTAPLRRSSTRPRTKAVAKPRGARLLDALLTGRSWIALIGVLLAGIVFFNVDLLQMNRDITQMADRAAQLKRENARLRLDVARQASSERIQESAAGLGLVLPAPADVRYLNSHPRVDARQASKRMSAPNPTYVAPAPTTTTPPTTAAPPTTTTTTPPATGAVE